MKSKARLFLVLAPLVLLGVAGWLVHRTQETIPPATTSGPAPLLQQVSETRWRISRVLRDRYLKGEGRLNGDFHLQPTMIAQSDGVKDLVVVKLASNSPMAQAGFHLNDRILKVNGTPVANLTRAVNLVHEVEGSSRLTVQVERDGKILDYQFDFE